MLLPEAIVMNEIFLQQLFCEFIGTGKIY